MKPLTCCAMLFVLLAAAAAAGAETKFDAAARAKAIAPFVEEETMVVAHVDLSRVALQPTIDLLNRVLPDGPVDFRNGAAAGVLKALVGAGFKELFLVAPAEGVFAAPQMYTIWPIPPGANEKALRTILKVPEGAGQMIDGALVLREPQTGFRSRTPPKTFRPMARPELTAAFEAAGDTAAQLVLIPTADARRVVEELTPQLPKELGGGSSTVLTRGIAWAALGIDFPPHPSIALTIRSQDAAAAAALRAKLAEMLKLAGQLKPVRAAVPRFEEAAALLAPNVEGDRLVLRWNEKNRGIEKFLAIITPPIEQSRVRARAMDKAK